MIHVERVEGPIDQAPAVPNGDKRAELQVRGSDLSVDQRGFVAWCLLVASSRSRIRGTLGLGKIYL